MIHFESVGNFGQSTVVPLLMTLLFYNNSEFSYLPNITLKEVNLGTYLNQFNDYSEFSYFSFTKIQKLRHGNISIYLMITLPFRFRYETNTKAQT